VLLEVLTTVVYALTLECLIAMADMGRLGMEYDMPGSSALELSGVTLVLEIEKSLEAIDSVYSMQAHLQDWLTAHCVPCWRETWRAQNGRQRDVLEMDHPCGVKWMSTMRGELVKHSPENWSDFAAGWGFRQYATLLLPATCVFQLVLRCSAAQLVGGRLTLLPLPEVIVGNPSHLWLLVVVGGWQHLRQDAHKQLVLAGAV